MPTLPTIEVTEEQHDLIWSSIPGETDEEKEAIYADWLKGQVTFYVLALVRRKSLYLGEEGMIQAVQEANDLLNPPPPL